MWKFSSLDKKTIPLKDFQAMKQYFGFSIFLLLGQYISGVWI